MNCPRCQSPLPAQPGLPCPACAGLRPPQPRAKDPLLGAEVAGRFRIEALIGQGGMGKVYRARHLALGKDVCLKVLKPALLEDPTLVGRFEREAQAASRLNHPNTIEVLDFGRTGEDGTLYIAMEYVQGKDLRLVARDEGPLSEARIVHLVAQVLAALSEAHARSVIHRDLKPENIMVAPGGPGADEIVKVLDFGIAKILDADLPGLTRTDVVCGTPQYMAPEQATGSALDARCDLYAVGVILYQLTTCELPFEGQNSMEVLTRHVNDRPQPPRQRAPHAQISEGMEKLILRALEKEPARRPQSASEFRRLLLELPQSAAAAALRGPATPTPRANPAPGADRLRAAPPDRLAQEPEAAETIAFGTPAPRPSDPPPVRARPPALPSEVVTQTLHESRPAQPPTPPARSRLPMAIAASAGLVLAAAAALALHPRPRHPAPARLSKLSNSITPASVLGARERAAALVEQAQRLQHEGDPASARARLEQAVQLDPENARAHYDLGGLYLNTQPLGARAQYDRAAQLDPAAYAAQVRLIESTLPAAPGASRAAGR